MSKPRGMPTQGARLIFKPAALWLKLEGLSELGATKGSTDDHDVTDFDSEAKQSIQGLPDFGEVTLGGNFLDEVRGPNQRKLEKLCEDGAEAFLVRACVPVDSTKTKFIVKEYLATVKSFEGGGAKVNDKQPFTASLKVQSKPKRYDNVLLEGLEAESLEPAGP